MPEAARIPPYLRLRRGQQQVTASLPGLVADTRQRGQAAAIDEFQAGQIDDDLAPVGGEGRQRSRSTACGSYVQLSAQRHHDPAAVSAGTQAHTSHRGMPSCHSSKGKVWTRAARPPAVTRTLRLLGPQDKPLGTRIITHSETGDERIAHGFRVLTRTRELYRWSSITGIVCSGVTNAEQPASAPPWARSCSRRAPAPAAR